MRNYAACKVLSAVCVTLANDVNSRNHIALL